MDNNNSTNTNISKLAEVMPDLIKNNHFNFSLSGWPAATVAIGGIIGLVTSWSMYLNYKKSGESQIKEVN